MRGTLAATIERLTDRGAAASLGCACGFALWALLGRTMAPTTVIAASATAFGVYLVSVRLLAWIGPDESFAVPHFDPQALELTELDELVLTDADRLHAASPDRGEELLLDDVLAQLGPNSRVVRLFDPANAPTPGQLDARIRQHLRSETAPAAPPDDSQALHDALAALKHSLR